MYPDKFKFIGEHSSVAEELLGEVPELEQKCRAVEKSVKEGYFTIHEALHNYKVSEIEYLPYLLLRHNQKLKKIKKQSQLFDTISTIVSIFSSSKNNFDVVGKKALADIKKITEKFSTDGKILVK
ncbi:hypothetical protein BH20BAC1_BH20BAC1_09990 [soil metagenome]|jgi:hypothetical protein